MKKHGYIYILSNKKHGTLYTGVTSNLSQRILQHKSGETKGFTQKYGCDKLVYVEKYDLITDAIKREKQIKAGSRQNKIGLIESLNPERDDLSEDMNYGDII